MKNGLHRSRKILVNTSILLTSLLFSSAVLYLDKKSEAAKAETPSNPVIVTTPEPTPMSVRSRREVTSGPRDSHFDILTEIRWIGFEEYAQREGATYRRSGHNLTITMNRPGKEQAIADRIGHWLGCGLSIQVYNSRKQLVGQSVAPQNPSYPWNEPPLF
mgnify:CR=1 FL=1